MTSVRTSAVLSLVAVLFLLAMSACTRHESPVSVETLREDDGPVQETWNPVLRISEEGLQRLHLRSLYMARFERDSTYMVFSGTGEPDDRVRVDLFGEDGDSTTVVLADEITYFERNQRFVARGRVVVTTRDDKQLESEHLAWWEESGRISTPGLVTVTEENRVTRGYEFEANEDLTELSLQNVTGTSTRVNE